VRTVSGVMYKETTTTFNLSASHLIRILDAHGLNHNGLSLFCLRLSSIPPNELQECTLKQGIAGSFSFCVIHFTWAWRWCQQSDSLRAGRSGDRIPIEARPTRPDQPWVPPGLYNWYGVTAAGA
jgi:hypothetical protein